MTRQQREAVRVRLAELEFANGGRLTPSAVVEDARDPKSPLHDYFEWDVKKAAMSYWLDQARTLITSVMVVQSVDRTAVQAVFYVRDPSAPTRDQGYLSVDTLRTDAEMAREAIVQEFSRAADMLRRAKQLAKVLHVEDDVEALVDQVVHLRERVQSEAVA